MQPLIASPTLPQPKLFTKTVEDPVAIGAAWEGQGLPGSKWPVFTSDCLLTAILLTNTLRLHNNDDVIWPFNEKFSHHTIFKTSTEFLEKLNSYLGENLTIDDILDRILEVGYENITIFEKYYLGNNIEIKDKK